MPRKLPPFVERWRDRHGKMRHYFRKGKGARFPLPWSRDGRVRSGLSSRSYGATCSEAMRRARSHCSNSFSGYENSSSSAVLNS